MKPTFAYASTTELLETIAGKSAAYALMERYGALHKVVQATYTELLHLKGVGPSKAKTVKAALHLAQRLSDEQHVEGMLMDTPESIADAMRERCRVLTVENLFAVLVNTRRRLIAVEKIAAGTLDTLLVHPREVFKSAIAHNAAAIVLVHNHPSGDPSPSEADIKVTRDLFRGGQFLKIELMDHVILGLPSASRVKDYVSLREMGYLYT